MIHVPQAKDKRLPGAENELIGEKSPFHSLTRIVSRPWSGNRHPTTGRGQGPHQSLVSMQLASRALGAQRAVYYPLRRRTARST